MALVFQSNRPFQVNPNCEPYSIGAVRTEQERRYNRSYNRARYFTVFSMYDITFQYSHRFDTNYTYHTLCISVLRHLIYNASFIYYNVQGEHVREDGTGVPAGVEPVREKYAISIPVKSPLPNNAASAACPFWNDRTGSSTDNNNKKKIVLKQLELTRYYTAYMTGRRYVTDNFDSGCVRACRRHRRAVTSQRWRSAGAALFQYKSMCRGYRHCQG